MATLIETGQVSTLRLEADTLHRMRLHDRRCDLAQIDAKVDAIARTFSGQKVIEDRKSLDSAGQAVEALAGFATRNIASLHADQRRYHLEIVFHAMLQFAKQDILVAQQLSILFGSARVALPDPRQGHEAEYRYTLIALDRVRPRIDIDAVAVPIDGEGPDIFLVALNGLA